GRFRRRSLHGPRSATRLRRTGTETTCTHLPGTGSDGQTATAPDRPRTPRRSCLRLDLQATWVEGPLPAPRWVDDDRVEERFDETALEVDAAILPGFDELLVGARDLREDPGAGSVRD